VFLDAADAGNRFRRDPQRLPVFARLILGDPEMNNTVADDDVLRPDPRPLLAAELGEETGADRAVVALTLARWCALCRPDRADNVCPADGSQPRLGSPLTPLSTPLHTGGLRFSICGRNGNGTAKRNRHSI